MLLRTKGVAKNIGEPIVGKVTRNPFNSEENTVLICEDEIPSGIANNFLAVLTRQGHSNYALNSSVIISVPTFEHLQEGDIVTANNDGNINTLYRVNSFHNTIFATERCNSNCLMCSQPPKDKDDISRLYEIYQKAIPLIPKDCFEIGISGGEPTLMGELF